MERRNSERVKSESFQDSGWCAILQETWASGELTHEPLPLAGLTDYEVRDVNDEINKLMREKRHWENQIIALGGANYRRNVAMLDDDGKEVPGTKGYKCVFAVLD